MLAAVQPKGWVALGHVLLQGCITPGGSSWSWSQAGGTERPCAPGAATALTLALSTCFAPWRGALFSSQSSDAAGLCCPLLPSPALFPPTITMAPGGSEPAGRTGAQCWVLSQSHRAQSSPRGCAPRLCAVSSPFAGGVLGGLRCLKGILYKAAVPLVSQSPPGGRSVVYIDSCTISQPLPPPQPPPVL